MSKLYTSLSNSSAFASVTIFFCSLENLLSSALWKQPAFVKFSQQFGEFVDLDYCQYRAHYLKPTRLFTNLPLASSLARRCRGNHYHDQFRGTAVFRGKARWKTSLASAYPPAFARALARVVRDAISEEHRCRGREWEPCSPAEIEAHQARRFGEMCRATKADQGQGCRVPIVPADGHRAWSAAAKVWGNARTYVASRKPAGQGEGTPDKSRSAHCPAQ